MTGYMKVRCVDNRPYIFEKGVAAPDPNQRLISLTEGGIYEVLNIEEGWYRLVDDTDEDYLYPPEMFEIVDMPG